MKRIMLAALAAGALALGACADPAPGSPSPASSADAAIPATTTTQASFARKEAPRKTEQEVREESYLKVLREEGIYLDDKTALLAGRTTCQFIDEDGSVDQLFYEMASDPYDQVLPEISNNDLPFIMGAAVGAFCPEHRGVFQ